MPDSNASIAAIEIDTITKCYHSSKKPVHVKLLLLILDMYFLLGINGHKDESMDKQEAFSNYRKKI